MGVFSGFPWCQRQLGSHFISLHLNFQHCIKPKCYCHHGTYFSYRHGTSQCWYYKKLSLNSKFTVYEVFCNNTFFAARNALSLQAVKPCLALVAGLASTCWQVQAKTGGIKASRLKASNWCQILTTLYERSKCCKMKAFSTTSQPGKVQAGEAEQHQLQVHVEARER